MTKVKAPLASASSWPSPDAIAARISSNESLVPAVLGAISSAATARDLRGAPQLRSKVMRRQILGQLLRVIEPDMGRAWPGGVFSEAAAAQVLTDWEHGHERSEVLALVTDAYALALADPITFDDRPAPAPMEYFTFVNRSRDLARVHHATCPYCKFGAGVHHGRRTRAGWWSGPYSTYDAALAYAEQWEPNDSRGCKHCLASPSADG